MVAVDVCGSYFKNPCYVGSCINDLKGSYSCICPPNHIERVTLYGFPTCDPANSSATIMTVTGDNWQCSDVSALVGLSLEGFYSNNAEIDCNQPLPKGSVIQLGGTPDIPCTAFFYALKGDSCLYISMQLDLGEDDLAKLNPGLDCSPNGLKAGQSVCIERSTAFAYTVPECLRYDTLTPQDTCEVLLRRTSKEAGGAVNASNWAELYRNNPGLTCSSAIPSNIKVQVCLRAEYWPFTASVICKRGRSKKSKALGFESQCVHFGHPSAGGGGVRALGLHFLHARFRLRGVVAPEPVCLDVVVYLYLVAQLASSVRLHHMVFAPVKGIADAAREEGFLNQVGGHSLPRP
ncbi:unnamed protein product [Closterium sp. NIES-53]